ncbi:MAG: O-antigen ligase family protein [Dyadobacter sp.]
MDTAQQIVSGKINRNFILPVILFFFLNIGNYSFLRYSLHGTENTSGFLNLLSGCRIALPLWIMLYSFNLHLKLTTKIFIQNTDVFFLGICWLLSGLLSMEMSSYLLYGVWTLLSIWAILLFISYTAVISQSLATFTFNILRALWYGNFVILILDFASLIFLKPSGGMLNIFFASNTFWAYPTMVMGILALIKLRFTPAGLGKKFYYVVILIISVVAIYFSARRSPLFCLIFTIPLLYLPLKLPQIIFIISLFIISYFFIDPTDGKDFLDSFPDSYMKYRIERMFGLVEGRKETSYSERQKIWNIYLNAFYKKPVMGEGLAAVNRIAEVKKNNENQLSAHNTFIGLLAETGLSGSLLLLVVIVRSILLASRISDRVWKKIYIILFIPTLLINWVEYNLIPGQIFFLYTMIIWLLPRGLQYLKI